MVSRNTKISVLFLFLLTALLAAPVTATDSGTDYNDYGVAVTFAAGASTATPGTALVTSEDTVIEDYETITLTLTETVANAVLGSPSTATVYIRDTTCEYYIGLHFH